MMSIPFFKMHGAGNDFIAIDDRDLSFPIDNAEWMAQVGARRTGVGCDGFILIQPSEVADLKMRFFNPDGNEAEMCGNGARCFASLAVMLGAIDGNSMKVETVAGCFGAEVLDDQVQVHMPDPEMWQFDIKISEFGSVDFVNTGVPHAVLRVDDLALTDVQQWGRAIRTHSHFLPNGTNVNFVEVKEDARLFVRTYERGVEAETLACGTGVVASALVAAKRGLVSLPVSVLCASGDYLRVDAKITQKGACDVVLSGPAVLVYEGHLKY